MTALRCPRCHRDAPELTAFCPGCGAPLLFGDEAPRGTLDATLDLDRRGFGRGAGDAARAPPPVEIPGPAATPRPFRTPLPQRPEEPGAAALRNTAAPRPPAGNVVAPTAAPPRISTPRGTPTSPTAPPAATRTPRPGATRPPIPAATVTPPPTATVPAAPTALSPDVDGFPEPDVDALELHLTRASSWRRVLAWVVDGVPFAAGGGALGWSVLREAAAGRIGAAPGFDEVVLLVLRERSIALSVVAAVALALVTYATLAHTLAGATLGKRLLGIRVIGPDGAPPSFARSSVRSLLAAASIALLGTGFLLALFTRTGRALHDLIARTWVVKAP